MATNVRFQVDPATGGTIIPVHSKRYSGSAIIVDAADVAFVVAHRWRVVQVSRNQNLYAVRTGKNKKTLYLHRVLMGITDPKIHIDHKNRNGLDCRRENLRIADPTRNAQNARPRRGGTSQYKGVSWVNRERKWRAFITQGGKRTCLGYFTDEIDAARAYDAKARELFGAFACCNFDDDQDARKDAA